jgi:hypothetical protein
MITMLLGLLTLGTGIELAEPKPAGDTRPARVADPTGYTGRVVFDAPGAAVACR